MYAYNHNYNYNKLYMHMHICIQTTIQLPRAAHFVLEQFKLLALLVVRTHFDVTALPWMQHMKIWYFGPLHVRQDARHLAAEPGEKPCVPMDVHVADDVAALHCCSVQ